VLRNNRLRYTDKFALFESSDLVARAFEELHSRNIRGDKVREIVAHVAQGRAYLAAAENAEELVQPLLRYYGALGLTRAFILLKSPILREASMTPSHGLSAVGWKDHFATGGSWLDARVRIDSGTFSELASVTSNASAIEVLWRENDDFVSIHITGTSSYAASFEFRVRDVIARLHRFADLYEAVTNAAALTWRCELNDEGAETSVEVMSNAGGLPTIPQVVEWFSLTPDTAVRTATKYQGEAGTAPCLVFAIRGALGAGRARVMRQVLTESLLIALAGGLAGIALAYWGVAGIRRFAPASLPRVEEVRVDARALGFTLAAVVLTAFAFGMLPALRAARSELSEELRSGTRAIGSQRQHRLRGSFVIAELAFAVILLISAGLLVRSFISVTRSDRGYQSDHVLATTIFVYRWNKTPAARGQFIAQVVDRVARIPGVIAAGATSSLPLDMAMGADQGTFTIPGRSVAVGAEPSARMTSLTPAAFNALRLTLRRGRLFTARDDSSSIPVAIVSEEMARRYWPGEDPIGKPISMGFYSKPGERQIVGVVSDIRQVALDAPTEPTVYVPHAQAPTGAVTLVLRTAIEPRRLARDLKRAVAELNPELPLTSIQTLDDLVATSLTPRRFTLILFASFSLAAVVLAVVGVYGVISQSMTERSKEFGVRLALGAQSRDIVHLATRQGIAPVAIGVGLGLLGAGGLTTLLRGMLFSVVPLDLPTYFGVSALMLATALLACYIPARRATRLDPLMALRTE
jgi:hypothetical protein